MSDHDGQVTLRLETGEIPTRTCAVVYVRDEVLRAALDAGEGLVSRDRLVLQYTCIDCGWQTTALGEMLGHQHRQAEIHTCWQRLRRWLALW